MKKKLLRTALLTALFAGLLCVGALAADSGGMYNVTEDLTPQAADGSEITDATSVDGKAVYVGAERVALTYSQARSGYYYVVFALNDDAVPTESNIVYIDQQTAAGTEISFNVYPSRLEAGRHYTIYLSSNDGALSGLTEVASFDYYAPYTLGDVNADGKVDTVDAMFALQMAVRLNYDSWTQNQWLAANVNRSDTTTNYGVDTIDAMLILQRAVGLITEF